MCIIGVSFKILCCISQTDISYWQLWYPVAKAHRVLFSSTISSWVPQLCIFGWPRLNSPGHGDSCEANLAWAQYRRLLSDVFHGLRFPCLPCYADFPLQIGPPFQRALVLEWRWDWFLWVPGGEPVLSKCSWQAFSPGDRCICSAVMLLPSP